MSALTCWKCAGPLAPHENPFEPWICPACGADQGDRRTRLKKRPTEGAPEPPAVPEPSRKPPPAPKEPPKAGPAAPPAVHEELHPDTAGGEQKTRLPEPERESVLVADDLLAEGQVLDNKWRVARCLGEGGFGAVYLAEHTKLPQRVAIKMLHPKYRRDKDALARLDVEARTQFELRHPGVVELREYEPGRYLVMEYVQGPVEGRLGHSLRDRLESDGPVPVERMLDWGIAMARALEAAHALGIVHLDIKPENVLLDRDLRPKLTDFGIAKRLEPGARRSRQTQVGILTPQYGAIELEEDRIDVDGRADVYSLGRVLYELVTGQLPSRSSIPPASRYCNGCGPAEDAVLARATQLVRDGRFASMTHLRQALEQLAARREAKTVPRERSTHPSLRHRLSWAGGAGHTCSAHIFADPELVLGRNVDKADIVLQFLPAREPANDGRSAQTSREHARLIGAGGAWSVRDLGSRSGTYVRDRPILAGQPSALSDGDTIRLGAMELRYLEAGTARVLRRVNNREEEERYVLVTDALTVGSGPTDAVSISGAGLVPGQIRLARVAGGYDVTAQADGVAVEGVPLPAGATSPLLPGAALCAGKLTFRLECACRACFDARRETRRKGR